MAKQLNINLAFTADTARAKAQLQDLQSQLTRLINQPTSAFGNKIAEDIEKASLAAAQLKVHLENATNVDTGTLDFAKLDKSLKKSGVTLETYASQIRDMGPEGAKSFMMLAEAVASAEVPIKRSNALLTEMWTTMKNTARWQISSSILHGFMGALQTAYGYSQDLNESLNNIRIVTGNSVDEMAQFAAQANKAAKALSSTTTEYTNAALIYYQQGLQDSEIEARTETTLKMANVSRQSAEIVSDQMTAIWNNFYDGSQSIEYYADVITALGAATASSTDEIAEGLEKFAAVSETVGLSYEYATAALATVTATTRQSADIVGNAFKTLFARIQGLNLGETLDDGTTLNKYSQALEAVGISIFESNGQIKEMDDILDEMGSKWGTLNKAQQTALAQTVAGVRQYTQLIALMDNWEDFQTNLGTASTATGALEEQQKIYEESWEAASDRVRAAFEGIYDTLINDEFFIDLLNVVEKLVGGLDNLIDRAGGLKGVMTGLGLVFTKVFSTQLSDSVSDLTYNLSGEKGRERIRKKQENTTKAILSQTYDKDNENDTIVEKTTKDVLNAQLKSQQNLVNSAKELSEFEKQIFQHLLDQQKVRGKMAIQAAERKRQAEDELSDARVIYWSELRSSDRSNNAFKAEEDALHDAAKKLAEAEASGLRGEDLRALQDDFAEKIETLAEVSSASVEAVQSLSTAELNDARATVQLEKSKKDATKEIDKNSLKIKENSNETNNHANAIKEDSDAQKENNQVTDQSSNKIEEHKNEIKEETSEIREHTKALEEDNKTENDKVGILEKLDPQDIVATAEALSQVGFGISSINSAFDTLQDTDLSSLEKIQQISVSLTMGLPTLINGLKKLSATSLGSAIANTKLGKSFEAMAGGTKSAHAAFIGFLGPVLAVGAALGSLYLIIKALNEEYNKDAIAADRVAEATEHLKQRANEAKQEVDNLKSSFDQYESALETLNSLEEGMIGFKDATEAVNDEVLKLLQQYPELAEIENIVIGKPGSYKLDQQKVDSFIAEQERKANAIQSSVLYAQSKSTEARNKADLVTLSRSMGQGHQIEFLENNIEILSKLDPKDFEEKLHELTEGLHLNSREQNGLIETYKQHQKQIQELGNSYEAANNQINNYSKLAASNILGSNATEEQVQKFQDEYLISLGDESYNALLNEISGVGIGKNSYNFQEHKERAAAAGITLSDKGIRKNIAYVLNEDGKYEEMPIEAYAMQISQYEAVQDAEEKWRNDYSDKLLEEFGINKDENLNSDYITSLYNILTNVVKEDRQIIIDAFNNLDSVSKKEDFINKLSTSATDRIDVTQDAEKYDLDAKEVKKYTEHLLKLSKAGKQVSKDLENNAEIAGQLAVANARMNKGLLDLSENFIEYREILRTDSSSLEYSNALNGISAALNDILGIDNVELSEKMLSDPENLNLIQQAIYGNIEALEELRLIASEDIINNSDWVKFITEYKEIDGELVSFTAPALPKEEFKTNFMNLVEEINSLDLEIGQQIPKQYIEMLQELIKQSGLSVDTINDLFKTVNFLPEIEIETITVTQETLIQDPSTGETIKAYEDVRIQVPKINSLSYNKSNPDSFTLKDNNKGSKQDLTKKSDFIDRYKEENDALDNISKTLNEIADQSDRAFGANRLKLLEKETEALNSQTKALENKKKEIEKYLALDKQNLQATANKYGIEFIFDSESGDILNYTEVLEGLYQELNKAEKHFNSLQYNKDAQSKYQESTLDPLKKKIDEIKSAISLYDSTKEEQEKNAEELRENLNKIQDINYEKLEYELELKIEINEADLKRLDFFLERYSDDFYKMADSAAKMLSQGENYVKGLQNYAILDREGSLIDDHAAQLKQDYESGKISQEAYINGMKNVRDGIYDQLKALDELDKEMRHFYEDTLSMANEELSDYIDHMEHLNGVFDHFINIMDILGKSKDYEAMGNFLSGKAQTSRDRLDVAQSNLDMLESQKASIKESLDAAIASGDQEAIDYWTDQWDYIVDATDAAQEEVLSLTEQWASDMKAVIQNNLNKLADDLEKSLTEGMGFERLMDNFDKLNERQEEYLTKTNQVYETNKLMRQANKALDETDNKVAKQKLKNFIDETKNLQQNTKLSKYELEIQQAKYDLLLAEIALEEAKNAKSTVRLSRDSEGNFGYVYTADQDKIDEAQQAYDDADNRLYNISLEGQQKYTEKYLQAQQDMYNELAELQEAYLNGEIETEEEYKARQQEIMDHYYGEDGVLTTYANLYNVAVRTDADATADNWQKNYGDMTQDTEKWKDNVNEYLKEVEKEFDTWGEVTEQANEDVKGALENSKKATEELTDESKELKDTLVDDVIPAIEEELDAVKLQIEAYDEVRKSIEAMTDAYIKYLETLDQDIEAASTTPSYDKDVDYTALAIGYLRNGGKPGDKIFNDILEQRDAKIRGEGLEDKYKTGEEAKDQIIKEAEDKSKNIGKYADKEYINDVLDDLDIETFATGGYTGDWGPYGKLAVLHQKELVLNEYDTKNLLNTISMIKDIVGMIDSQAQLAALSNLHASFGADMLNQKLEQMVTIHAEFPNATEHNEIEEAFNNLINKATQYANRK